MRALEPDPAQRYPSARALADDFKRFQAGLLVDAHQYSWSERLVRFARRHAAALSLAALALMVVLGVTGLAAARIIAARNVADQQRDSALAARHR